MARNNIKLVSFLPAHEKLWPQGRLFRDIMDPNLKTFFKSSYICSKWEWPITSQKSEKARSLEVIWWNIAQVSQCNENWHYKFWWMTYMNDNVFSNLQIQVNQNDFSWSITCWTVLNLNVIFCELFNFSSFSWFFFLILCGPIISHSRCKPSRFQPFLGLLIKPCKSIPTPY